jgi:hypothetical protein
MIEIDREKLAWAAGLFEGEGSFVANRLPVGPSATLSMADEDIVRRFAQVIGGGSVYCCPPRRPGWKPLFKWAISGHHRVQAVVAMLWPWLSPRRRAQAKKALLAARQSRGHQKWRKECIHGHPFTPENTYVDPRGARRCRTCKREWMQEHYRRRRERGAAA